MAAMAAAVVGFADWKIRQTLRKSRLGKLAGVIKKRLQLRGWDRFIPSFVECRKNDHQKLKEELEQDLQHDFLSTCEATCNRLVQLNKKYPQQFLDPEGAFAETKKQFCEKQILISVLGCHGSGKSTLLNALLDCTILPMSTVNETAMRIHIQNDDSEVYPKLVVTCDGQVTNEVIGAEEVCSELSKLNGSVRNSVMLETKTSQYRILMPVQLLSNVLPVWNVSLVDTPGFGEYNAKVSETAAAALSASSACMYITTSGSFESKTDTDCFKELHRHGVIEDGRLVIVVTKFDENYTATSNKVLDEEQAKERVASSWLKATNQSIPLDRIIVVAGLWAYKAQELRKSASNPASTSYSRHKMDAMYYLSVYPGEARGEQEGFDHLQRMSTEQIAEKLKEASGIVQLEKSIRHMAMKCGETWIFKMRRDYTHFLSEMRESLEKRVQEELKHYGEKDELNIAQISLYDALTEFQSILKAATVDKSSVHKAMEQAFDEDLLAGKPEVKGREAVDVLLNKFREKCRGRINDKNDSFGPEEFQQELQLFFEKVKQELESTFNGSCQLVNINRSLTDHVDQMATKFEGLKACAEKFLSEIPDLPKFEDSDVICDQPHEPLAPPDATANLEQLFSTSPQADTSASSEDQQQISTQPDQLSATFQETCTDDEQIACSKSDKPEPTEAAKCTLTLDEATKVRNLGQLKEIISIPPVTLSYWEQFIDWLKYAMRTVVTRSGLQEAESGSCDSQQEGDSVSPAVASMAHDKKKTYRYQSDTDMPISDLKKHIMTGNDHYSRDIKPYVVQYFFNEYRKRTEKKLMQFESEFGDRIAERLVQLHKLADQLDGLHEEIGELEVIIDHLRRMTEHLEEKAEIFRKTMVFSEI